MMVFPLDIERFSWLFPFLASIVEEWTWRRRRIGGGSWAFAINSRQLKAHIPILGVKLTSDIRAASISEKS
jgi:hypothetical protein